MKKKTDAKGKTAPEDDADAFTRRTPSGVVRPAMATLTDPVELEDARRRSMRSTPPAAPAVSPPATRPLSPTATRAELRAALGPLDRVPKVRVSRDQLRWLSIDHRTGFVLSLVDGVSTAEMILDVSGMPEVEALRLLAELVQQGIVGFD